MPQHFKKAGLKLTTSYQKMYGCPVGKEIVIHSLFFTSLNDEQDKFISVKVFDKRNQRDYLVANKIPVPPGTTLFFDKIITLEEEDEVHVKADTNLEIESYMSFLEITNLI